MKKVKLFMILMCVLMCLSGCTIGNVSQEDNTKTTCKMRRQDNVLIEIILKHNGEEVNDESIRGEMKFLDYTAPLTASLEEQELVMAKYFKKYPEEGRFVCCPYFAGRGDDKVGYVYIDLSSGKFRTIRDDDEVIDFFKLTPELLKKEVLTYSDFIEHLKEIGYTCE